MNEEPIQNQYITLDEKLEIIRSDFLTKKTTSECEETLEYLKNIASSLKNKPDHFPLSVSVQVEDKDIEELINGYEEYIDILETKEENNFLNSQLELVDKEAQNNELLQNIITGEYTSREKLMSVFDDYLKTSKKDRKDFLAENTNELKRLINVDSAFKNQSRYIMEKAEVFDNYDGDVSIKTTIYAPTSLAIAGDVLLSIGSSVLTAATVTGAALSLAVFLPESRELGYFGINTGVVSGSLLYANKKLENKLKSQEKGIYEVNRALFKARSFDNVIHTLYS